MTYPDLFVLCACSKVHSIGTEANTADIQIAILVNTFVLQLDNFVAGCNFEDLSRAIATSSHVFSILTKSHAADNTIVMEIGDQLDIEDTAHVGIENSIPVIPFTLLVRTHIVRL